MIDNIARTGNITSSEISALCSNGKAAGSFGEPFYTYVEECNFERMLGRSLSTEIETKPMTWGHAMEMYLNHNPELLGLEYEYCSQNTIIHPTIDFLVGTPDNRKYGDGDTVVDTKAPYSLKSFCTLVAPIYDGLTGIDAINAIRNGYIDPRGLKHAKHKDGEKFYQQLISNSILTKSRWAELIIYCPYKSELQAIRELAEGDKRFYWIWASDDTEVPYLPDGGKYQNKNVIRFEVPEEDKIFLTSRVLAAGGLLQPR